MRGVSDQSGIDDGLDGRIDVLHMITGLNVGGAETMLARLLAHPALRTGGLSHQVLSLLPPGPLADRLRSAEIPVRSLGMRRSLPGPGDVLRLLRHVRGIRPRIIHGWMYHGNLAATVGQFAAPRPCALMWNIRHSVADLAREPLHSQRIIRMGARLSNRPVSIICNSHAAVDQHAALGYLPERMQVIGNGFDCDRFAPDRALNQKLRAMFRIPTGGIVVAMVARAHPMKSVDVLVNAVILAREMGNDIHLLLVGDRMDEPGPDLRRLLERIPAGRRTLSGARLDVAAWLPGVDILAMPSSWGEGFPNILGEAMACGIPCVATDVGDAARLIGQTGLVVPVGDAPAMAQALDRLVRLGPSGRELMGSAARKRIRDNYSLQRIATDYADLYLRHAGLTPRPQGDAAAHPRALVA
jgi:glycosyltransferase involved in cell wall biosynthesis